MSISETVIEVINKGRAGENKGLSMGMPKLESVVDGVMPGTYTIIAGGTSTGKTSLALYSYIYKPIMENIDNEDFHIIYFSLEMKAEILFTKLLSIYIYEAFGKELSYKELLSRGKDHKLSDEDYELVLQSKSWLDRIEQIIRVYDKKLTADIMYAEITERLKLFGEFVETENRKLYVPNKKNQIILVVIDHLGLYFWPLI